MQRYYILLKATGAGGWPGWLPYRLDADSAEQAVEKAKEQAENHYPEYEKFEVQAIEIERRSISGPFVKRGPLALSKGKVRDREEEVAPES